MSYERSDAVIVQIPGHAMTPEWAEHNNTPVVDLDAFRQTLPEQWRHLVLGPIRSVVNNEWTVAMFLPDGSKEGWPASDDGDEYRRRFTDLFAFEHDDGSTPYSIVHVRFGGAEPAAGYEPELIADNGRGLRIESTKEGN